MIKGKVEWLGNVCPTVTRENPNQGRVYRKEGICPCLNAMRGGNRQPFIIAEVKDEETDSDKLRMDGKAKGN